MNRSVEITSNVIIGVVIMGKSWDTKKVNDFIDCFEHATHNYMEVLGDAYAGYERYQNNDTFVGGGAEQTKIFIGIKQSEFNCLQYDLSKEMIKRYVDLDDMFKAMVDPAADAKIDTDVVRNTKEHFQRQFEEYESVAFAIQQRTMEDVDKFKKYCGDIEEVYVRDALAQYDEFCCNGGFLDSCIKKMEEFDEEATRWLLNSGLKDAIQEHIAELSDKATKLDSIHPQVVGIDKQIVGISALKVDVTKVLNGRYNAQIPKYVNIYGKQINLYNGKSDNDHIYVDDSKRVRIGTVSDTFIQVTGVPVKDKNGAIVRYETRYGGNQAWLKDIPKDGKRFSDMGCGVVASVNQYLYLTGQTTITYDEYKKVLNVFLNAEDQPVTRRDTHSEVRQQAIKGPIGGALPDQMSTFITTMCKDKGVNVSSSWDSIRGYEADYENMKKQLEKGIPVIWSVHSFDGDNVHFHEYDPTNGAYLYVYDEKTDTVKKGGRASSHYVIATGIYEDYDDTGNKRRMVEISSWGEKYYVDYDQYIGVVSKNPCNQPFSSVMNTKIN